MKVEKVKDVEIVRGFITITDNCDSGDGVKVNGYALSAELEHLKGKNVTVRFYISDEEKTADELRENMILSISGSLYANYGDAYSEYTGYLWTNDELQIDGHDLLEDISEHVGKFVHLEVDIH